MAVREGAGERPRADVGLTGDSADVRADLAVVADTGGPSDARADGADSMAPDTSLGSDAVPDDTDAGGPGAEVNRDLESETGTGGDTGDARVADAGDAPPVDVPALLPCGDGGCDAPADRETRTDVVVGLDGEPGETGAVSMRFGDAW